ncbi:MAG: ATP-binding protein [Alphaproteobacteria bacterium]|nr:ATP-binding protein [Alphaproteobacteria bacterium]MDE1930433.1 ATP-binding protein [Alphaproteobacteria bacterium]
MSADRLKISLANRLSEIAPLAERVSAFCAERRVSESVAFRINLALEELLTNTIKYGYADQGAHEIAIELQRSSNGVTVEIVDDGKPFDLTQVPTPDLDAPIEQRAIGGLGIHFVRTMMDEVRYCRDGSRNRVTLVKRTTPDDATPAP